MRRLLSCTLLILLFGCTDETINTHYSEVAVITGYDGRYCLNCCGGLIIYLEGKTDEDNFNLIENPSEELGIDSTAVFPVNVNVGYGKT